VEENKNEHMGGKQRTLAVLAYNKQSTITTANKY